MRSAYVNAGWASASATTTVLLATAAAWAQQSGPYYREHMWGGGFGWVFGPLMMILFLAVIIGVVILILRWLGIAGQGAGGHDAAMTTLRERFARGEIDKEEFEERSRLLAG